MSSRMSAMGWRRSMSPPSPSVVPDGIIAAASARETTLSRNPSVSQLVAAEEWIGPGVHIRIDDCLDQPRPAGGERRGNRVGEIRCRGHPDAVEPRGTGNGSVIDVAEVDADRPSLEMHDLLLPDVAVAVVVH